MTRIFSTADITLALQVLGDHPAVDVDRFDEQVPAITAAQGTDHVADSVKMLRDMAALVDGRQLDRADLSYLLGHQQLLNSPATIVPMLEAGLGYPSDHLNGVKLAHYTVPLAGGGQVAGVIQEPPILQPGRRTVVYLTGLHQPSSVNLPLTAAMALQGGRRIISVDLPSMGGSRLAENASVYADDLLDAVVTAIVAATGPNEEIDVVGHSLGTLPAILLRDLSHDADAWAARLGERTLVRVGLLDPVPDEEMRAMGVTVDGGFTKGAIPRSLTGTVQAYLAELFDNAHTPADREQLAKLMRREALSASLWSVLDLFITRYLHRILDDIGHDPNLFVAFSEHDDLIVMRNRPEWEGRRGVIFLKGDHTVGNPTFAEENAAKILHTLNDPLDPAQPLLDRSELYQSAAYAALSGGLIYGNDQTLAAQFEALVYFGLLPIGPFGFFAKVGGRLVTGYDFAAERPVADLEWVSALGLQSFALPISASGALVINQGFMPTDNGGFASPELLAEAQVNLALEKTVRLTLAGRFGLVEGTEDLNVRALFGISL